MAAVDARVHAAPVAAPGPDRWNAVNAKDDAYRRVTASGTFRHDRETLVQAVTERGAGYWVVTPLETPGFTLLVNRGFVPKDRREAKGRAAGRVAGPVTVTGLLRVTEPERSEEHTSELQSLMRNSYAVFCLQKKNKTN